MYSTMQEIIQFFDRHAPQWDSYSKPEEIPILREILARSPWQKNETILDVASGTGVLIPYYRERGFSASQITAIDISPKMVEIFSRKFPDIPVVLGDFMKEPFPLASFTTIMIFNSFPHFRNAELLFMKASSLLKQGGQLIIAHSMTREALDEHHRQSGATVQNHLLPCDCFFYKNFASAGFRNTVVDNQKYFYARGEKI